MSGTGHMEQIWVSLDSLERVGTDSVRCAPIRHMPVWISVCSTDLGWFPPYASLFEPAQLRYPARLDSKTEITIMSLTQRLLHCWPEVAPSTNYDWHSGSLVVQFERCICVRYFKMLHMIPLIFHMRNFNPSEL